MDNLYAKYKESTAENTKGILRDLLSKRVQFKKVRPKEISAKIKKLVESTAVKATYC
jgi:IS30 family transposase